MLSIGIHRSTRMEASISPNWRSGTTTWEPYSQYLINIGLKDWSDWTLLGQIFHRYLEEFVFYYLFYVVELWLNYVLVVRLHGYWEVLSIIIKSFVSPLNTPFICVIFKWSLNTPLHVFLLKVCFLSLPKKKILFTPKKKKCVFFMALIFKYLSAVFI